MTLPADTHTPPKAPAEQVQHPRKEHTTFLELGQYTRDRSIPVPLAPLSRRAQTALWLLRIFALIVSFMVIYTFIAQLH
jgi:hypothetical protein